MEKIQQMGRFYADTLKKLCGADYDKVQAASQMAERKFLTHRLDAGRRKVDESSQTPS